MRRRAARRSPNGRQLQHSHSVLVPPMRRGRASGLCITAGPISGKDAANTMELTNRETWALIHGMVLGALFLLAFGGGLAGLWSLKEGLLTSEGIKERSPRLI